MALTVEFGPTMSTGGLKKTYQMTPCYQWWALATGDGTMQMDRIHGTAMLGFTMNPVSLSALNVTMNDNMDGKFVRIFDLLDINGILDVADPVDLGDPAPNYKEWTFNGIKAMQPFSLRFMFEATDNARSDLVLLFGGRLKLSFEMVAGDAGGTWYFSPPDTPGIWLPLSQTAKLAGSMYRGGDDSGDPFPFHAHTIYELAVIPVWYNRLAYYLSGPDPQNTCWGVIQLPDYALFDEEVDDYGKPHCMAEAPLTIQYRAGQARFMLGLAEFQESGQVTTPIFTVEQPIVEANTHIDIYKTLPNDCIAAIAFAPGYPVGNQYQFVIALETGDTTRSPMVWASYFDHEPDDATVTAVTKSLNLRSCKVNENEKRQLEADIVFKDTSLSLGSWLRPNMRVTVKEDGTERFTGVIVKAPIKAGGPADDIQISARDDFARLARIPQDPMEIYDFYYDPTLEEFIRYTHTQAVKDVLLHAGICSATEIQWTPSSSDEYLPEPSSGDVKGSGNDVDQYQNDEQVAQAYQPRWKASEGTMMESFLQQMIETMQPWALYQDFNGDWEYEPIGIDDTSKATFAIDSSISGDYVLHDTLKLDVDYDSFSNILIAYGGNPYLNPAEIYSVKWTDEDSLNNPAADDYVGEPRLAILFLPQCLSQYDTVRVGHWYWRNRVNFLRKNYSWTGTLKPDLRAQDVVTITGIGDIRLQSISKHYADVNESDEFQRADYQGWLISAAV